MSQPGEEGGAAAEAEAPALEVLSAAHWPGMDAEDARVLLQPHEVGCCACAALVGRRKSSEQGCPGAACCC